MRRNLRNIIFIIIITNLGGLNCKEVYKPHAIQNNPNLLVVDGIIISGNDSSVITLSRTRNLADTAVSVKELNAQVTVVGATGVEYPLYDQGNGRYVTDQLQLDTSQQYQLKVITYDGNEFRSEFNKVRTSPPIDSVYWNQDSSYNVHVYLNTHDPTNNTRYYRWEYVETWEYRSAYPSFLQMVNDTPVFRSLTEQIYRCYQTQSSSSIDVANTSRLSSDIVNRYEINSVLSGSEKITAIYSNLVKQYAITAEAFDFWQNLKKNTEQLGSLFDLQPFTELGNIHCLNNPSVKCIGYISFTTLQEKRIFISKNEVYPWNYYPYYGNCVQDTIQPSILSQFFPPGGPHFYSLIGTDNGLYIFSSNLCVDCTDHGGTTIKPPYWP
jgi:hypothetical protein